MQSVLWLKRHIATGIRIFHPLSSVNRKIMTKFRLSLISNCFFFKFRIKFFFFNFKLKNWHRKNRIFCFRIWGVDHDFTLEEILNELAFFRGESYHAIRECGEEFDMDCITMNFTDIVKMIRGSCKDVFQKCSWNDEPFDCCSYFWPMQTEIGVCYALNSINSEELVKITDRNKQKV